MPAAVTICVLGGLGMAAVMIGIDPHKGSHTAVAIGAGVAVLAVAFRGPMGWLSIRLPAGFSLAC